MEVGSEGVLIQVGLAFSPLVPPTPLAELGIPQVQFLKHLTL